MNSPLPDKSKRLLWILIAIGVSLAAIAALALWLAVRFLKPMLAMQPAATPIPGWSPAQPPSAVPDRNAAVGVRTSAFDGASFAPHLDVPAASGQASIACGDLDGDGRPDVVVADFSNRTVSVYRNISQPGRLGDSSFAAPVHFVVGKIPHYLLLADLDGDGKRDIVSVNTGGGEISLFRNTAMSGVIDQNSFAEEVVLITPADPRAGAAVDLNGDGKPELIIACYGSGALFILENNSTPGAFLFGARVNLGPAPAGTLAVGDVDGDGKADLVVPGASAPVIWIYRNAGSGGILTPKSFARRVTLPGHSAGVTLADMDGDGKIDIVSVHESDKVVSVLRNLGTPGTINSNSFAARVDFPTGIYPYMSKVARLDGQARPDIVVANAGSHTVSVYRNLSSPGSFTAASLALKVDYPTGKGPRVIDITDLDGDGWPDIANANLEQGSFSILRQMPPATR